MVWGGFLLWVTAQKKVTDSDNLEDALTNSFLGHHHLVKPQV